MMIFLEKHLLQFVKWYEKLCFLQISCFLLFKGHKIFFSLSCWQGKGDGLRIEKSGLHDNWDDADGYYSKYTDIVVYLTCMARFINDIQLTCYSTVCLNIYGNWDVYGENYS